MSESIINKRIGPYYIEERIKAGGVAIVYKATHQEKGLTVAFKLLQSNWAEYDEVVSRFEREARIMQQLRHPHIVTFYDYGFYETRPYIVMEYLPGGSLSERLKQITQISLGGSARLLAQIADALDYAHRNDIVHRDLKPGNILLKNAEHAALTDFGIARGMENTILTNTGYMPGTPHYMSPEQARGAEELNYLSDLYSLAVLTYLLSTGRLPFTGTDPLVIINQHLTARPKPPSEINPELPAALDAVLLKALEKEPTARYTTAVKFIDAFAGAISDHRKLNVTLTAAGVKPATPPESILDMESRVFSSEALPIKDIFAPPAIESPLKIPSRSQIKKRRVRNRMLVAVALVTSLIIVAAGVILSGNNGVWGQSGSSGSGIAGAGAVPGENTAEVTAENEPEATPTIVPTETPDITLTVQQEVALAATEDAIRQTAVAAELTSIAQSATPTPTPTLTPTSTSTPTFTSTPTSTPTPTVTPSPTTTNTPNVNTRQPSPTPYTRDFDGLLSDFTGAGTAGRFNCRTFVAAYDFLVERLEADDPEFEPARVLVENPDAPLRLIYEDYCRDNPESGSVSIIFALHADMRNTLEQIR
jgi:eukaryotic-like serine/threonine-protein kinase